MSKQLQFELWEECNSRCTYCSLGLENRYTSNEFKLQSIQTAYNELYNSNEEYDVVGFIGGEFFQGQLNTQEIKDSFIDLMKLVNRMHLSKQIKEVWINATMTIGDQKDLWEVLDIFENKSNLWILTSFDTLGRFHNPKMLETWKESMFKLHNDYPEIKINTTSILTGHFIDMYLNDEIDLSLFRELYHTSLFLKTPVKPDHMVNMSRNDINKTLGNFFPTRNKFQQFLLKYKMKEGESAYKNLFSNELKAEEVRKNFNDIKLRNVTFIRDKNYKETLSCDKSLKDISTLSCGHSNIYQSYCDCDNCSICDKQMIEYL